MQNSVDQINKRLKQYLDDGCNVPGVTHIAFSPPLMRHDVKEVIVNPDAEDETAEVYLMDDGFYSFTAFGVDKFRIAAGITFDPSLRDVRVDDGKDPDLVRVKVIARRFGLDGLVKQEPGFGEIIIPAYEDAARVRYWKVAEERAKAEGWSEAQKKAFVEMNIKEYSARLRAGVLQRAVTKAKVNCVTKLLGLRPRYTKGELLKPFIIVVTTPDFEQDKMVFERYTEKLLNLTLGEDLYQTGSGIPSVSKKVSEPDPVAQELAPAVELLPNAPANQSGCPGGFAELPRVARTRILTRIITEKAIGDVHVAALSDSEMSALYNKIAA
ncbi:MAG: hypothetical protein ACLP29_00675 [Dissulfurispiraceae bacterium]